MSKTTKLEVQQTHELKMYMNHKAIKNASHPTNAPVNDLFRINWRCQNSA